MCFLREDSFAVFVRTLASPPALRNIPRGMAWSGVRNGIAANALQPLESMGSESSFDPLGEPVGHTAMSNLVLIILLVAVTAVWGWTFTVVQQAVEVYGVIPFLAVRFLIGAICLAVLGGRRVTRQSLIIGGLIGLALAAGHMFQTLGLRWTTPTNSGLITSLFVVIAPLLNWGLFGVRTSAVMWGTIALSVVGLGLLTGAGATAPTAGDLVTLGAAAAFALHIVLLDRLRHHDALGLTVIQVVTSAAIFLVAWPMSGPVVLPTSEVWWVLALTGVVATALGFYIQTLAQARIAGTTTAVLFSLEALFAMFFGYLLAGDRLTVAQLIRRGAVARRRSRGWGGSDPGAGRRAGGWWRRACRVARGIASCLCAGDGRGEIFGELTLHGSEGAVGGALPPGGAVADQ